MEAKQAPVLDESIGFSVQIEDEDNNEVVTKPKGLKFNLALVSLSLIAFCSTLDGTILATALPKITNHIRDGDSNSYVWIANSFILAQTVIQPPLAQLCNIFGRRTPLLVSILFFMLGSGVSGGSHTSKMLIAGRTIQGIGSGGIMLLIEMVICDLVPLRERGKYLGIVLSTCSVGAVLGPVVGGALADTNWRWIFYMNLPIAGTSFVVMSFCLQLRAQEQTWKRSLARVDWIGSVVFIASMCAVLFGLIAGGSQFPWSSWRIILPLALGSAGLAVFGFYEALVCNEPSIPPVILRNRTSAAGFWMTFIASVLLVWVSFFLPFYFQSVRQVNALRSGVMFLPFQAFFIPSAAIGGFMLTKTGLYKPFHLIGFALITIGVGLLTLLNSQTSTVVWVVFQAIDAIGQGCIIPSLLPAIQSSLQESDIATSTGMFSFLRSLGYVWGITVPSIIFNNQWDKFAQRINDPGVRAYLSNGQAYRFASSMYEHPFNTSTQAEVISSYTGALRIVWIAAIPFAIGGFLSIFVERQIRLREDLNTEFGLSEVSGARPSKSDNIVAASELA